MGRTRTGNIVVRNGRINARVTYVGEDGKRHAIWRAAKNMTHARQLIPEIIQLIGNSRSQHREPHRRGFIYAIRMEVPAPVTSPIKIGFAVNVHARVDTLLTGSPYPITILGFWETANGHLEEKRLHEKFADSKMRGEWFTPSTELLQTVKANTEKYGYKLRERAARLPDVGDLCPERVVVTPWCLNSAGLG